jgi:hypothetical protein
MSTIKFKRGSALRWSQINIILADGEPGYEEDTGRLKVGDGKTPWNSLAYFSDPGTGVSNQELQDHINSLTPHPVYDDGPSFLLLYENAKV